MLLGRKRLKEREKTDPSKDEKVQFSPNFRSNTMNTLNIIRKQINKVSALHDAQITHTSYRGVEYNTRCVESKETHGTFCYRGRTYSK
jgi:hypothetical protein